MNISYDHYRVFYYAARYGSFTAAAEALMNNQPNITRMVKKLEGELGCALFIRQRHGIRLTAEGERLYVHVSAAFEHLLAAEEELAGDRRLERGMVTVASSGIALRLVLLPALRIFRREYPGIRVRILNHSSPQAITALKNRQAELAVLTEPFTPPSGFLSRTLRRFQETAVCSASFPFSFDGPAPLEKLASCPLIGLHEQTASFSFYSGFFRQNGLAFAPDIEVSTTDQILPIVESGLGIGFVPVDFLKREKDGRFRVAASVPPVPERHICLLKPGGALSGPAARRLEQTLLAYADGGEELSQ